MNMHYTKAQGLCLHNSSPVGLVLLALQHNIPRKHMHSKGMANGVKFLAQNLQKLDLQKIYTMINVLEKGTLD